jgi:hypothetical protein
MNKFRKLLKRLVIFSILIILLLSGLLFITGKYFGDQIEQAAISELNKHLKVEISVADIELSFLKKFPFASIELSEVQTRETGKPGTENLLSAKHVYILYNLYDIVRGKYRIEKIIFRDAFLNIIVNEDGSKNLDGYLPKNERGPLAGELQLKNIEFYNVEVSYLNYAADQEYLFRSDKSKIKATFAEKAYSLDIDGSFYSHHIRSGDVKFLEEMFVEINTKIDADIDGNIFHIINSKLIASGVSSFISGKIISNPDNKKLDLQVSSHKNKLDDLILIIPKKFLVPLKDYDLQGNISLNAKIFGDFSGNNLPEINIDFEFENGNLGHPASGMILKNVSFTGYFNNGKSRLPSTYYIELTDFKSEIPEGGIDGKLSVFNFNHPEVSVHLISSMDMTAVERLFSIPNLESIRGQMELDMVFSNKLKGFKQFTVEDFLSSRTSGTLEISGAQLKIKNSPAEYKNLNGSFEFSNSDLRIKRFIGFINESDFSMDGYFRNILPYLFKPDEKIQIAANFQSNVFDLDHLIKKNAGDGDGKYEVHFSDRLNFDLNTNISNFKFRRFEAQNIRGRIKLVNQKLFVDRVTFQSMAGESLLNGSIDGTKGDHLFLICEAELKNVDIRQLFYQLGDFGQDNITHKNLGGIVDADIFFQSTVSKNLKVDAKSVNSYGDIVIRNGELLDYSPLYKLAKYIKQGELEHIRFSTLKNSIRIKDEVVYIPEMDIESSSLNLKIEGSHSFQNIVDYKIQVLLSELLSKKRKQSIEPEGIIVEDDGLGRTTLFLKMTGDASNPEIKYDTREVRKKIASDLKEERENIKQVLKKEFEWLAGEQEKIQDTLILDSKDQKKFIIEWEEQKADSTKADQQKKPQKEPKKGKTETQKKFIIQWDETNDTIK